MESRDFSWALRRMRSGEKMCREGWYGKGLYVAIQRPDSGSVNTEPYCYLVHADGRRVPWVPSQGDLFAEDWRGA